MMAKGVKQEMGGGPGTVGASGTSAEPRTGRGGAERRSAIFDAALRLFREQGFHATSIDQIGAASGVTGPAIYRHFDSKAEVLAEAIGEGARRIADATRDALHSSEHAPVRAVERLVRAYVEVALDNADIYAAYVLEARHLNDELRKPLRRNELRHQDGWIRLVQAARPDMDPEQVRTVVKMAISSVTSLCLEPSPLERQGVVDFATQRVMALLLAPAPDSAQPN
jgi:AcrR family transcriptional regulator